jgi:hypothetical protein
MNLLRSPGTIIYGITALGAFLCGLLVSITLLVGFAYSGLAGDAPGGFLRYSIVAALGISATVVLFVGLLGTSSRRRTFPLLTVIGTALLLILLGLYAIAGARGEPLIWSTLLILIGVAALIFSSLKLKQLRSTGVTPWQP